MVQLVTSKPPDVETLVRISVQSHELGFFLTKKIEIQYKIKKSCPTSGERLIRGYLKFDFTVDEGKGRLSPSRDRNKGRHRRRKVEKSCVTSAGASTSPTFRINEMTTHTHRHVLHFNYRLPIPPTATLPSCLWSENARTVIPVRILQPECSTTQALSWVTKASRATSLIEFSRKLMSKSRPWSQGKKKRDGYFTHRWGLLLFTPPPGSRV